MENDEKVKGRVRNDGVDVQEEEEEEENHKMEQFFALIRGFHEAKNRRKVEILEEKERKNAKKTRRVDEAQSSSWVPSFALEDFKEQIDFRKPPAIVPELYHREDEEKDHNGIDLKLTL